MFLEYALVFLSSFFIHAVARIVYRFLTAN